MKRLERAKSKAEAVSRRHLDELALIRRLQRQKVGVGRKQKLTVQERETKKLLDAKVRSLRLRLFIGYLGSVGFGYLRFGSAMFVSSRFHSIRFCWVRLGIRCEFCVSRVFISSRGEIVAVTLTGGSSCRAVTRRVVFASLCVYVVADILKLSWIRVRREAFPLRTAAHTFLEGKLHTWNLCMLLLAVLRGAIVRRPITICELGP